MLQQVQNISFFHRWFHFQHLPYILILGTGTDSEENYSSLYSCIHIWWIWVGVTIHNALLLLMIYCSCSCDWFSSYFYWKSCVTCSPGARGFNPISQGGKVLFISMCSYITKVTKNDVCHFEFCWKRVFYRPERKDQLKIQYKG